MNTYQKLTAQFQKIYRLNHALAILSWDEAVMMPSQSGEARAESVASLSSMAHELLIAPEVTTWIDAAKANASELDVWQQRNLYLIDKKVRSAKCLAADFVERYTKACMQSEQAWRRYRTENDWQAYLPYLESVVSLTKEKAQQLAETLNISAYDALLDVFSPGVNQAMIDPLFAKLAQTLPAMVDSVIEQQPPLLPFEGNFAIAKQKKIAELRKNGVYGAAEAWYSPNILLVNASNANGAVVTRVNARLGARLKFGVQSKQVTLYGIGGFAYAGVELEPVSGVYNQRPGVVLTNDNRATSALVMGGVGLNYAFDNGVNISAEYVNMQSTSATSSLTDAFMTFLGVIGSTRGKVKNDSISIGLRYLFKPFMI